MSDEEARPRGLVWALKTLQREYLTTRPLRERQAALVLVLESFPRIVWRGFPEDTHKDLAQGIACSWFRNGIPSFDGTTEVSAKAFLKTCLKNRFETLRRKSRREALSESGEGHDESSEWEDVRADAFDATTRREDHALGASMLQRFRQEVLEPFAAKSGPWGANARVTFEERLSIYCETETVEALATRWVIENDPPLTDEKVFSRKQTMQRASHRLFSRLLERLEGKGGEMSQQWVNLVNELRKTKSARGRIGRR